MQNVSWLRHVFTFTHVCVRVWQQVHAVTTLHYQCCYCQRRLRQSTTATAIATTIMTKVCYLTINSLNDASSLSHALASSNCNNNSNITLPQQHAVNAAHSCWLAIWPAVQQGLHRVQPTVVWRMGLNRQVTYTTRPS